MKSLIGFQTNKFSILWRGTRDGFDSGTFHSLCDGKGSTLTVIKTTLGYILGGYTSLARTSVVDYKTDSTAFLYTLTNPSSMPLKLAVNAPGTNAVLCDSGYGPTFGINAWDLNIGDLSNTGPKSRSYSYTYALPNGLSQSAGGIFMVGGTNGNFQTVDVEVYLVT